VSTLQPTLLQRINDDAAAISERVLNSLVQINNGQRGVGAGAIWRSDGLILTNAHVILGRRGHVSNALSVTLRSGKEFLARLVAYDMQRDLAALRIDATEIDAEFVPVDIGNSRQLKAGDYVLALGFPWGVKGGATSGIVIGSGAQLPELGDNKREWIAASLHLRPGHSGGPMVDSRGRVIGINTLMNGPEVGVAIPVHIAQEFLNSIAARQNEPAPAAIVSL
jgi:serine protease Do